RRRQRGSAGGGASLGQKAMKSIWFHHANLAKHGISEEEVQECLHMRNRKYFRRVRRKVYQVIGPTAAGRYLEVIYELRSEGLYVFHAMDALPWQIRLLKRRGKRL